MSHSIKIPIRVKLGIILIIISCISIYTMAVAAGWNAQRQFVDVNRERDIEIATRMVGRLENYYAQFRSWDALRGPPRTLLDLLGPNSRRGRSQAAPRSAPRGSLEHLPIAPGLGFIPTTRYADNPVPDFRGVGVERRDKLPLPNRVQLLNKNREKIAGFGEHIDQQMPIKVDGEIVGWLGIEALPVFSVNPFELALVDREITALYLAAAIMAIACFIAAIWFARQFERPIAQLGRQAHQMTQGNFKFRSNIKQADELGQFASDLDQLAAALEHNEKLRKQWLSDTSHELRTPLAILKGEIEALRDNIRKPSGAAWDSLEEEVTHLTKLIEDLHVLSLIDEKQFGRDEVEPIELNELIRTVVSMFETSAKKSGIDIVLNLYDDPVILGNRTRLHQLISNLVANGIRYTHAPGHIVLKTFRDEKNVVVAVEDTPPCPSLPEINQLFDRFYRSEKPDAKNDGSGIGLSICLKIVALHRGSISAYPAAFGGLGVRVSLPLELS